MTFLKTNIITLASKMICLASTLFISVYIARFLGPFAKGAYYLLAQIVSILATLSLFGIDTAAIYCLGKGAPARGTTLISSFITVVSGVAVAWALFAARAHFLKNILSGIDPRYLILIALAIPFMGLVRLYSAIVMGFGRYIAFNILNITLFLALAAGFVGLVIFAKMGLAGALISFALAYFIMSFIYLIVILSSRVMRETDKAGGVDVKGLLSYGARIFLVPVLLLILYRIDSFFLSYCINAKAVGFYSVALSLAELLLFIPESTGTILFPKLAYTASADVDRKFVSILRVSIVITVVGAGLFFAGIRYVLPLVYGRLYLESVPLANILLPGLAAMSTYYLFASYFQAIGRPGLVSAVLAAVLLEKVLLCGLLIPRYGAGGAAMAATISYLSCFAIFLWIFRKRAKFAVSDILMLKGSDLNFIFRFYKHQDT